MTEFVKVARLNAIRPGQITIGRAGIRQVALTRVAGRVVAFRNLCPHAGQSFAGAVVHGATVTCPRHAWVFGLGDGECAAHPGYGLRMYEVKVEGEWVFILPSEDSEVW
jgi:nitrite reductase/ring-hydroxylating ferredoxin subunit